MVYRKKPVEVQAFQLGVGSFPDWFMDRIASGDVTLDEGPSADINTLEGVMHADCGDFIIMGVAGEIYPCKPDIFMKTYEPVEKSFTQVLHDSFGCELVDWMTTERIE
jgi:hypothetical protein